MKRIIIILTMFLGFVAQTEAKRVIDTLTVEGNCSMCKERIETALDVRGVKYANWNIETKKLVVAYNDKRISLEEISAIIQKQGHSTNLGKAEKTTQNKLPLCCKPGEECYAK